MINRKLSQDIISSTEYKEVGTTFNGMTIDQAYENAGKGNMVDYFLGLEFGGREKDILNKAGLVKTGDEYATPTHFAVSGYELFDLTPNLPLQEFWHQVVMPKRIGGGFVETVSALRLSYQLARKRLASANSNETNVVDALPSKITVPAYTYRFGLVIGEVELLRTAQVAYDVLGYKLEALRVSYQAELEWFSMLGNLGVDGITSTSHANFKGGLLNNAESGAGQTSSDWYGWDITDWIENIIGVLNHLVLINRYAGRVVPDTIAFGTDLWVQLSQPAVIGGANGVGVLTSNLEYIKTQVRARLGRDVDFVELPYVGSKITENDTTAGIVAKGEESGGQIIFFKNDESVMRMHITQPLMGGALHYSPTEFGHRQNFLAVNTTPLFIYPTSVYRLYNKLEEFAITYSLDSGTNNAGNPETLTAATLPITLLTPTKANNVFTGWFTDAAKTIEITTLTERKAYTLYAGWEAE